MISFLIFYVEMKVYFTAINCWVHNGGCKQTFPKLRTFPIILGYVGGSKGVQYRGPLQHQYINTYVGILFLTFGACYIMQHDKVKNMYHAFLTKKKKSQAGSVFG